MKNTSDLVQDGTQEGHARRALVRSGVLGLGAALLGSALAACSSDDDADPVDAGRADAGGGGRADAGGSDGGTGSDAAVDAGGGTDADIAPLNGLLTDEYTAIAAYGAGAGLISAAPTTDPLHALVPVILNIGTSIIAQHSAHAAALVREIEKLGGTPVSQTEVSASFTPPDALVANPTVMNVLKFAASAEREAAVEYNNTVAVLEASGLRQLAASIAGGESQHFIVLTAIIAGLAGPGPELRESTAGNVFPAAFVVTDGSVDGLDAVPPDYFA
jgi:bacterioferritin (cytochrome b1)